MGLKGNQEKLLASVSEEIARDKPIYKIETEEKQSGRVEVRKYEVYDLAEIKKEDRWETSQIKRAIRVIRETTAVEGGKKKRGKKVCISQMRWQRKRKYVGQSEGIGKSK